MNQSGYGPDVRPGPMDSPTKEGKGCFFYGCVTSIVLLLVLGIGGYFAVNYAIDKVGDFLGELAEDHPTQFPVVQFEQSEFDQVRSKVDNFVDAVEEERGKVALDLGSRELNILLQNHPHWKEFGRFFYVDIEGDRIKSQVSVPIEQFIPALKGKYLNGTAELEAFLRYGQLVVKMKDLKLGSREMPSQTQMFIDKIKEENLASEVWDDPKHRRLVARIKSIEVRDGRIYIETKH